MNLQHVRFEAADGIATLTVNRPDLRNALNLEAYQEIAGVLDRVESDPAIRALIVTGAGEKAFISGADIKWMAERTAAHVIGGETQRILSRLEALRVPVIAAVNGWCLGAGMELAAACDIILAADTARFGLPEVKLGVIPSAGGTQRMTALLGPSGAKAMILTGEFIDAEKACRLGLVYRVLPLVELMPAAREMAARIAANGPLAVRYAKEAIQIAAVGDRVGGLAFERFAQGLLFTTEDRAEGLRAFLEKREPRFQGR